MEVKEKDKKPKKRHKRLKFPQTRRDRLKGAGEPDHKFGAGISRLSSIHSVVSMKVKLVVLST